MNDINTPMFDPKDRNNEAKISHIVRQNFLGQAVHIPADLQPHVTQAKLTDLLDFSRKDFNKAFSLTVKKLSVIDSRYPLVKLGDFVEVLIGGTPSRAISQYFEGSNLWVSISEMNNNILTDTKEKITDEAVKKSNVKLIPKGTTLLSFKLSIGKTAIAGADLYTNEAIAGLIPKNKNDVLNQYLYCLFNAKIIDLSTGNNAIGQSLNSKFLREDLKIPLPPLNIQQKIVAACEVVDEAVRAASLSVEALNGQLTDVLLNQSYPLDKLANVALKVSDSIDPQQQVGVVDYVGLENIESQTGLLVGDIATDYQTIKSAKTRFVANDVLYGKLRPNLNKVYLAQHDGICSTDILVFRFKNKSLAKFFNHYLKLDVFNHAVLATVSGQQLPRTSWGAMQEIKIPVPPLAEQSALVAQIEAIESQIAAAQQVIDDAPTQKMNILRKHL